MKRKSETDWERLRTMTDEEAERGALADPDAQPLDESFWASAKLIVPPRKKNIHIGLDEDILEFFRAQGRGYQTRINAVLRQYIDHQRNRAA